MLVPDSAPYGPAWLTGSDEVIATPGRADVGLELQRDRRGAAGGEVGDRAGESVVAATVIAAGAFAGELIEP